MEIKIVDLTKVFSSRGESVKAVDQVTEIIPAKQIFTLLGPSGCGKTTLLRCIMGLEVPDSGEIAIGDTLVWSKAKRIFIPPNKRGLSMVFQTYAIWPHMTVFDNVAYPLQVQKIRKAEIKKRVKETLQFVKLEGLEKRPATALSGGQQQRVALARALVSQPKVILFDEPLSNLDAKLREETRKELRRLLMDLKITAVYVTHDRLEALTLADLIAVMRNGRIVEVDTPKGIYFKPKHRFVADFVGKANFIDGKIVGFNGPYTLVMSQIGVIACEEKVNLPEGKDVAVCIRPESIELLVEDIKRRLNTFSGKLESSVFIGEAWEGMIRVGEVLLLAQLAPTTTLSEGSEVKLFLDPKGCHILEDEG